MDFTGNRMIKITLGIHVVSILREQYLLDFHDSYGFKPLVY